MMNNIQKVAIMHRISAGPIGVLAPVSAHLRHSALPPIDTCLLKNLKIRKKEKEERERKKPLIVATTFSLKHPSAAHALCLF